MPAIILSRLARPMALALTLLLSATGASAQLVNDGATAIINGTATNIASFLTIGNTGPNTTLIVTNAGSVSADSTGIGGTTTSSNNLVAVSGAGSQMTTPGGGSVFRIGDGSAFNRLLISEGGAVTTGYGVVGYPMGASNNSVLVTGSGSAWTNSVLYVGEGAMDNSVIVADGGQVQTSFASTIGVVAGASNNWVTVTGPDSLWSTAYDVLVGDADGQNRLFVNNGGTVTSGANLILGNQSTSGGNHLSVAGGTATVTNVSGTGTLDVRRGTVEFNDGLIAADQLLLTNAQGSFTFNGGTLITRGATINNGQDFTVGANAGTGPAGATFANTTATTIPSFGAATPYPSVINVANLGGIITKVTVTLSNLSHTYPGDLDVLLVGPDGQKVMLMSDAGSSDNLVGVNLTFADAAAGLLAGTDLITNGVYRPTDYEGGDLLPNPAPAGPYPTNLATFNGASANGAWSLYVMDDAGPDIGSLGAWSLTIVTTPASATRANGALITINDFEPATPYPSVINVANLPGSVSRVTVTISNFTHDVSHDVDLLLVNPEGAAVALMRRAGSGITGATLTFDDSASSALPFSSLINSGTYRPSAYIGGNLPAPAPAGPYPSKLATFNGSNPNGGWSLFVNDAGHEDIGAINNGWSLKIETVTRATWDVRSNATPTTVSGGLLLIGNNAPGATLLITNGATLSYSGGFIAIGREVASTNNRVVISNPGSTLNNPGSGFYVGNRSGGNSLVISNGATSVNIIGFIGDNATSSNNRAIITGTNSLWSNIFGLDIGGSGSGNQLVVSDGAVAANGSAFLGRASGANNNMATVTGAGSLWANSFDLTVGESGSGNQLTVSNGAVVANLAGILGSNPSANNNAAVVTGPNSAWINSGELRVGDSGSFNILLVANGGAVSNTAGRIGLSGNNNAVTVSGTGSVWNNSAPLFIGFAGNGNQLAVSNGAVVINTIGYLGENAGANNNRVTVTDPGSRWINRNSLLIGNQGSFNSLLISNGAEVVVGSGAATIGNAAGANTNQVTVTGTNSLLRCASQRLNFGANGSFNTLLITNGGTVHAEGVTLNPGGGGGNLITVGNGTLIVDQANLKINGGSLVFNGGVISAPELNLTGGTFTFNFGTLNILHALGATFTVGDGINAATYFMSGISTDTHLTAGLVITNHATLSGNGSIQNGLVTVTPRGTLSPGSGIGTVNLQLPPALQGKINMEITKSGGMLTNDFISIGDILDLGGSLVVSNLGPDALAAGDSFTLFSTVGPIEGAFSSVTLPPLPTGLSWTNKLLVNGSIAVVAKSAPNLTGLVQNSTNLIYNVTGGSPGAPWYRLTSTNVALPLANWTTNGTGVFNWLGNVTVTNGINFAEPQRYFRISAP